MMIETALQDATKRLVEVGVDSAALDASVLMSFVTGREKIELITNHQDELNVEEEKHFHELINRRAKHEPVAYIIGHKEFWGRDFAVKPGVLIPRPDTETMIATLLALVPDQNAEAKIADLGLGSGCILISLLLEFPQFLGFGVDISKIALKTTMKNAAAHDVLDRLSLYEGRWADPIEEEMNIIVSNPPYIRQAEMATLMADVRDYEPETALAAGEDGLDCYRELIPSAHKKLIDSGLLMLEVGYDQAADVMTLLNEEEWADKATFNDLAGRQRVVAAVKKG